MNIAILHPAIEPDAALEDQDTLVQAEAIANALRCLGHEPVSMPYGMDLGALREALLALRPQMVFNLAESLGGADSLQYVPPGLLDALDIPYTGNTTEAIFQTTHKLLAKQILSLAGLPTPPWLGADGGLSGVMVAANPEHPPCILKAVWEHASRGMDERSVISNGDAVLVRERLGEFTARIGRPCFAEQFIEGREFNVAMLDGPDGPQVLPPGEIDFSTFPPGKPRIVCHKAKWHADSFEYDNTPRHFVFPAEDRPLLNRLRQLALDCWRLFSLRGYARVDFRIDLQGRPWILEVNTNPCLSPDAGYAAMVAEAGLNYTEAIERILEAGKVK
jgi:D-alanine-D-alanine ligase